MYSKFYIETKEDFALMLVYRENVSYEIALDICYFAEELYNKYENTIQLDSLIGLLIEAIKICIRFAKYHKIEKGTKTSTKLELFCNKLWNAKIDLLPQIIENYNKFLAY